MKKLLSFIVLGLLIISCNREVDFKPHAIDHEKDVCSKCMMNIAEDRYVVQAMNKNGDVKFFDDFGCYVKYNAGALWKRFSKDESPKVWITDVETGEWLEIEKAFFRYGDKSPMNYGFGALKLNADRFIDYEAAMKMLKVNNLKKYLSESSDSKEKDTSDIQGKCGDGKCGAGKCGG